MAKGKGRGARDLRYGRRGGGWVAEGHAPGNAADDLAEIRRKATHWPEHTATGSAFVPGNEAEWEGRARMAEARLAAYGLDALDPIDAEALRRYPNPTGWAGETARPRLDPLRTGLPEGSTCEPSTLK